MESIWSSKNLMQDERGREREIEKEEDAENEEDEYDKEDKNQQILN